MRGLLAWLLCLLVVACANTAGNVPPTQRDAGVADLAPPIDRTPPTDIASDADDASIDAPAEATAPRVPYVARVPGVRLHVWEGGVMFVTADKVRYGWGDGLENLLGQRLPNPPPRRRVVERLELDEETWRYDFSDDGICRWRIAGGGPLQCWGWLGLPDRIQVNFFTPTPTAQPVSDVDLASATRCASRADGVWCWPPLDYRQPDLRPVATRRYDRPFCTFLRGWLPDRNGFINCGYDCERQRIACRGRWWTHEFAMNDAGVPTELGTLDDFGWFVPTGEVTAIGYTGGTTAWIVRPDGTLWCRGGCGGDRVGTFGPAHDDFRQIQGLPPVAFAEGGGATSPELGVPSYACALLRDGTVTCWGSCMPQLGGGRCIFNRRELMVVERVGGLTNVAEFSTDGYTVCARTADEQVWCWGGNRDHAAHPAMDATDIWSPVRVEMPPRR